jgi:hypothetical protein
MMPARWESRYSGNKIASLFHSNDAAKPRWRFTAFGIPTSDQLPGNDTFVVTRAGKKCVDFRHQSSKHRIHPPELSLAVDVMAVSRLIFFS